MIVRKSRVILCTFFLVSPPISHSFDMVSLQFSHPNNSKLDHSVELALVL